MCGRYTLAADAELIEGRFNVQLAGLPCKLTRLLVPFPAEEMDAYEVSPLVNSPRNDIPECIARVV